MGRMFREGPRLASGITPWRLGAQPRVQTVLGANRRRRLGGDGETLYYDTFSIVVSTARQKDSKTARCSPCVVLLTYVYYYTREDTSSCSYRTIGKTIVINSKRCHDGDIEVSQRNSHQAAKMTHRPLHFDKQQKEKNLVGIQH